jgi:antirestriction protein ArdC
MQSSNEIRESITIALVQSLSEGRIPWRKPWVSLSGPRTATNYVSKRRYSGVNTILTMVAETKNNWPISYWATFNQFRSIGCSVKKGSKATTIVYWQMLKKKVRDEQGVEQEKVIPLLKTWSIFNVSQVEGDAVAKLFVQPELKSFDVDHSEFDAVVAATQARIEHGHEYAAFIPSQDKIIMPDVGRFDSWEDMASTLLHELSHWTQPSHRLNISEGYAADELFAEISSSYLMAELGIPHSDEMRNAKAYIQGWASQLKNDPKAIFAAAKYASLAADYIVSFSRPAEATDIESESEAALV